MANDSDILRQLHKIQIAVPDRDFFDNIQAELKSDQKKRRKSKSGLLSAASFRRSKKTGKIDIEIAREKIKSFNNSFKATRRRQSPEETAEPGQMSIQEMNDFRNAIKESAELEEEGFGFRALEAIVKFVDLKNSGVLSGKQEILFDCLKKLALVLMENGGLSMFHATWFYTVYKEYLAQFRMFRKGELEKSSGVASKEVKEITQRLIQKQYDIPHLIQLVDDNKRAIRQLLRYSRDPYIKRSVHGQRGCTYEQIKKTFHSKGNTGQSRGADQTYINEVNILMCYALFFTRMPMMHPLVEKIVQTIPNLGTETTLYKEKIMINLNLVQLDMLRGVSKNDGTDQYARQVFDRAYAVFKRCTNLITDNRLSQSTLNSEIYAFPFIKQAAILISYKQIFNKNKGVFLRMIENSREILTVLKSAAQDSRSNLSKAYQLVDVYERNLDAIKEQIKMDLSADNPTPQKKAQK